MKKESEIVALTATVAELKALMAKQPNQNARNSDDRNKSGSGWRNTPPKQGEPTSIERNGVTFNWCAHHKFWTKSHTTETCVKGKSDNGGGEPKLSLKVAEHSGSIFEDTEGIHMARLDDCNELFRDNDESLNE